MLLATRVIDVFDNVSFCIRKVGMRNQAIIVRPPPWWRHISSISDVAIVILLLFEAREPDLHEVNVVITGLMSFIQTDTAVSGVFL